MPTVAGRRYSYQRAAVSDFRDDCRLGYLEKRANRISSTESRPTIVPAKISSVGQRSAASLCHFILPEHPGRWVKLFQPPVRTVVCVG
jgi:hypothetical protein